MKAKNANQYERQEKKMVFLTKIKKKKEKIYKLINRAF